jgi:hypothetical protein
VPDNEKNPAAAAPQRDLACDRSCMQASVDRLCPVEIFRPIDGHPDPDPVAPVHFSVAAQCRGNRSIPLFSQRTGLVVTPRRRVAVSHRG